MGGDDLFLGETDAGFIQLPERGHLIVVAIAIEGAQFGPCREERYAQDFRIGALKGRAERLVVKSTFVKPIDQAAGTEIAQGSGA